MSMEMLGSVVDNALWAGLAALGFGILFNVPKRLLGYCILTAIFGYPVRDLLMSAFGLSIVTATFGAAILVGFAGFILARRLKAPSVIFSVTGVIPMVPGKFAYTAMISVVSIPAVSTDTVASSELIHSALTNLIQTGLILSALGLGIAIPALILERTKPVV